MIRSKSGLTAKKEGAWVPQDASEQPGSSRAWINIQRVQVSSHNPQLQGIEWRNYSTPEKFWGGRLGEKKRHPLCLCFVRPIFDPFLITLDSG
jgi:hypothetical protein